MNENQTYIIAEMACSHDGDISLAKKIIDSVGISGTNAIQFQIWKHNFLCSKGHPNYERLKAIELSEEDWSQLADYVRLQYPQLDIVACIYEFPSLRFAQSLEVDAFKIHASDLGNEWLLREVAKTGKRIDLSIGASTEKEIERALC